MIYKQTKTEKEVLDFIKTITDFDTVGDIKYLFTKGYCYGFALMLKQAFKQGVIYWDKYNAHAIIKIENTFYDINGKYEPMNYEMLRKVDIDIIEHSRE